MADRLPELALGTLDGTERADVIAHLERCPACRETTADFAATVDALPLLLGESEPPVGFEDRTLERLRSERGRPSRRTVVARVLAVAAAVAAIVLVTVATVRIVDGSSDGKPIAVRTAEMIGHSTNPAGTAMLATGGERYLWLDVDYGERDATYKVETVGADRNPTVVGKVLIRDGKGVWGGTIRGPRPAGVRLVDDEGKVWCEARFARARLIS
jgi:hypothetical protein